jgi:hypothetical protein
MTEQRRNELIEEARNMSNAELLSKYMFVAGRRTENGGQSASREELIAEYEIYRKEILRRIEW